MKTIELGDRDVETLIDALSVRVLTLGTKLELPDTLPTDKIRIQGLLQETKALFHRINFTHINNK